MRVSCGRCMIGNGFRCVFVTGGDYWPIEQQASA